MTSRRRRTRTHSKVERPESAADRANENRQNQAIRREPNREETCENSVMNENAPNVNRRKSLRQSVAFMAMGAGGAKTTMGSL